MSYKIRLYNRRTSRARAGVDRQMRTDCTGWPMRWAVARYEWCARDRAERLRLRWERSDEAAAL